MKLCFPIATDAGLESSLFGHFGSTPMFLLVDTESGDASTLANCDELAPDAGCNPFKALVNRQLDGAVVDGIGDGFLTMLNMCGMKVYQAQSASVKENVELFKQNALGELEVQNSELEGKCADGNEGGAHRCSHSH
jgi:predicted Fe-Mo cluster-binding NifX family protein